MTKIYYDELLLLFTLYLVYNLYKYGSFGFNYFFKQTKPGSDKKDKKQKKKIKRDKNTKIKIGLLTNEIPPVVYGGVATWIINFMKMFENDSNYEVVPIYLAYSDPPHSSFFSKYKNIRIIYKKSDINDVFQDIDVCVNNIWINLNIIIDIKKKNPNVPIISVCHSLIKMEHITNLGSVYTNNFFEQEIVFQNSDYVILISKSEKKYYTKFGYGKYAAVPVVIYNSYQPKFDNEKNFDNYNIDNTGYIGRHVPRKRPEIPILSVIHSGNKNVQVYNMGVDYKYNNKYWTILSEKYKKQLNIIPFSTDKKEKEKFYKNIGSVCITGIYEPFGYTICEAIDRRIPCISMDLDGPSEIMGEYKDFFYTYEVSKESIDSDVKNFSKTLKKFWDTDSETRRKMSEKARQALDKFRPEVIKIEWKKLLDNI